MTSETIFIIDIAARSAVVILLAWGIILTLPKLPAAGRYWIWFTALCALPLLLLTTSFPAKALLEVPSQTTVAKTSPIEPTPIQISKEIPTSPTLPTPTPEKIEAPIAADPPTQTPDIQPAKPSLPIIPIVYALGFLALATKTLLGLLRLRHLRRGASPIDLEIKIPQGTQILTSPDITIPMTWGTRAPIIALPQDATTWSQERLAVAIAHESAHIERHDFATGLIASTVRAIFWFQPLTWLALRQLWIQREIACDDRVLQQKTAAPADYAEHLSAIVNTSQKKSLGAAVTMGRPSEIVGRVRAILDSARNRKPLTPETKRRITLLALVLFLPLAFVRCAVEKSTSPDFEPASGIELVEIPPESITLTSGAETLEVPASEKFSIAIHEVTQAQFTDLLGHNPSSTQAAHLPVDRVTHTEAATFCKVLTERDRAAGILPEGKIYRLPTKTEWLLVAFPNGQIPDSTALSATTWHKDNSTGILQTVSTKQANTYGLHDMIGNAAEWVNPDPKLSDSTADENSGQYEASVLMQIHLPEPGILSTGKAAPSRPTPERTTYVQTQFQLIKSTSVLGNVVLEEKLIERWSLENHRQAVAKLAAAIRLDEVRGTDLISLTCNAPTGEDAVNLAESVAKNYSQWINQGTRERAKRILDELRMESKGQEKLMQDARATMLELLRDSDLVDLGAGSELQSGSAELLQRAKLDEYTAIAEHEKLRVKIKTLMDLDGDAIIKSSVQLGFNNPTLATRYPEYESAKIDLDSLIASGVKKDDPRVAEIEKKIDTLKAMLTEAVDQSRRTLGTQMQIAEESLSQVKRAKEQLEQDSLDEKRRSVEYLAAKDEYELHKKLLSEMKHRIAISSINERMPSHLVTIHERTEAQKVSNKPTPGTPSAIGGTAFDDPDTITDWTRSTGSPEERTTGVGFRFVLADE